MALPKLYDRVYWDNNTTPAINEDNLNSLSKAVDDIDDRVISLAGTIMEDVPQIQEDLEILEPAIENIDSNVERAETAADDAEDSAETAEYWANVSNPPIPVTKDFASVISVDDAIPKAATDVKAKVEAVQDLHGYTKPWVGGAGKNKLPLTVAYLKSINTSGTWNGNVYTHAGVAFSVLTDSDGNVIGINANGTATGGSAYMNFIKEQSSSYFSYDTYTISGCPSGGSGTTYMLTIQRNVGGQSAWNSDVGNGVTRVNSASDYIYKIYIEIRSGTTLNNAKWYPQVELGSAKTAFEPYTNICPISGFTEAKLTRTGKNLFPYPYLISSGYSQDGMTFNIDQKGVITVAGNNSTSNIQRIDLGYVTLPKGSYIISGMEPLSGCYGTLRDGNTQGWIANIYNNYPLTVTETKKYLIAINIQNGKGNGAVYKPMIRLATEADATFAPYTGTDYIIDLDGTRYGATIDIDSGVMTVNKGFDTYDGSSDEAWELFGSGSASAFAMSIVHSTQKNVDGPITDYVMTNELQAVEPSATWGNYDSFVSLVSNATPSARKIVTGVKSITNVADWKTYLASNPLQVCYELATPITVQLTPTEVQMLQGYNVLSANSGDVYLKYDASMIQRIANEKLDISTFKSVVAASSDFADFKTKVAAL